VTEARTLDVSSLAPFHVSNQSPLWFGQLLLCFIEGALLLMLIGTYFYLRLGVDVWPPPGVPYPDIALPTVALIPLLASCIGSYMASEAAKHGSRIGMVFGLGLNLALALVFLGMRAMEWRRLGFTWDSSAYGSIVWAILFLHTFDVVADLIMTAALIVIVAVGRCGPKQRIGVHVDSVLWYFLVLIWLPLYGVLYWAPRLIGGGQ
jgi:heme/copper-type cytochrome/quinol oxidase subunit 3